MLRRLSKVIKTFGHRLVDDHTGAYAATSAYFLMMSFVPFIMILLAISRRANMNTTAIMNGMISYIPSGLKGYVTTIINEVYTKSYSFVPVSILILVWSAAKFFHAITNGLNVINKTKETRGWFFLRFRSMLVVIILLISVVIFMALKFVGENVQAQVETNQIASEFITFSLSFRSIVGYIVLFTAFLFVYKVLPNCQLTFRSQLPGALIVTTIWVFFSYLISLYYENNRNFNTIYGSLTGVILAMIWLYFCMFFVLLGAELNRIILEDPEENVIVSTFEDVRESNEKKRLMREVAASDLRSTRFVYEDYQPRDIEIDWADEAPRKRKERESSRRTVRKRNRAAIEQGGTHE
ncbi:MAG: YihY/virulence factor BrkB family protein [Lachnospiraceae bacterium]|nr:YihY/virulence factor BrkB family protein [Lachnospiraceae bacterium]